MLKFAVVGCAVLWSSFAEAVKWDFDDGTTQGWSAKRAFEWGGPNEFYLFPGEVEDGVWRVDVSPSVVGEWEPAPNVALISYAIGYDSHLFDRVRIRFRTVHDRPTVGRVFLLGPMNSTLLHQDSIQSRQKSAFRSPPQTSFTQPSGRK